jgi:hypothetical protein
VFFLFVFEITPFFKCSMNGCGDDDYVESYSHAAAPEIAARRVQENLFRLTA